MFGSVDRRPGADAPARRDKEDSCVSRTPLKGGPRAGRERATETNLSAGDQEMKIQTKAALGQLPSAWVVLQ